MDERLQFVARLRDGERMAAALCREFDVMRKTGYKIFQRYKDCGLQGLTDRSRRRLPAGASAALSHREADIQLKRERPG
jgi:transposase